MNLLQLASSRLAAGLPEIPEALFLLADSSHSWLICPFVVSVHSLLLCLLLWLSEKPWPLEISLQKPLVSFLVLSSASVLVSPSCSYPAAEPPPHQTGHSHPET